MLGSLKIDKEKLIKMASAATIRDFLESSTIHGLVYISTAKSRTARAAWVAIVAVCFALAIHMITSSYKEWQESPVSTTITTHPITELEFPTVTVCQPRGSNTALNHLLEKVKDVNFTAEERNVLQGILEEVFLDSPTKEYAKKISEFLSTDNTRSIANKRGSMPSIDKGGMITMRSSELEGSFSSPGFLDSEDIGDFFKRTQTIHYVLYLPSYSIRNTLGNGSLIISITTEGNWSFTSPENKWTRHQEKLNW